MKEIDFIGEKDGDKLYIQVCYLLNDESTIQENSDLFWRLETTTQRLFYTRKARSGANLKASPQSKIEDWL